MILKTDLKSENFNSKSIETGFLFGIAYKVILIYLTNNKANTNTQWCICVSDADAYVM